MKKEEVEYLPIPSEDIPTEPNSPSSLKFKRVNPISELPECYFCCKQITNPLTINRRWSCVECYYKLVPIDTQRQANITPDLSAQLKAYLESDNPQKWEEEQYDTCNKCGKVLFELYTIKDKKFCRSCYTNKK